jgi:RNA polymerase sigma factor (sigma-70 family)
MNTNNYLRFIWEGCLRNDRKSQELLYKTLAPKMLAVCMRYAKDKDEAQDIMQEGFIKIFRNLTSYRNEGSLEGWIRRVMVHSAISRYRKAKPLVLVGDFNEDGNPSAGSAYNNQSLETTELMSMIQELPGNYRSVFNMYAIEGYSHQEIGESLGISALLSRATLCRARGILKTKLSEREHREMHYMAG